MNKCLKCGKLMGTKDKYCMSCRQLISGNTAIMFTLVFLFGAAFGYAWCWIALTN